ncbi:gluconokinase [Pedobacter gandavensis]|uniref:gluconokinase n=1 Tax=Pedobacter gandavensis TaxID=2679963 RepID=UPI00292D6860|nr:gluconokinase [Pedobacter gandavensis]
MKYILGIDIGTGSTKAVALNLNYEPIDSVQHHYPLFSTMPGYSEQNPELIWEAFNQCISEMQMRMGGSPEAIGLSSAMHSLISVDEKGNALAPMMTWADARSSDIAKRILESESGMDLYQQTGTPIHAMSPLCKLIWWQENEAALFNRSYKFISIKEYIWYRLFKEFKVDHSIASCTGLFSWKTLTWDANALFLAGITEEQLSEPVSTSYQRKNEEGLVFVIGASDGCLANLGSDVNGEGLAALTIGTSGAVRISSPKPIFNTAAMTFSYILDENTFICGGPVNNGGIALQWLLKNVLGKTELSTADYTTLFENIKTTLLGSNGLIFLPYLSGERAPIWDSGSCGTFFGLRLQHNQDHLSRAVLEGICYALNEVLLILQPNTEAIGQLHVSGGFVHAKVWMEILADITGKEIVLLQTEDASAIGAAYMAVKVIGLATDYPLSSGEKERIKPNPAHHKIYQELFSIYRQLYPALKFSMQQLEGFNQESLKQ